MHPSPISRFLEQPRRQDLLFLGSVPMCSTPSPLSLAIPSPSGSYVTLKSPTGTGVKHSLSSRGAALRVPPSFGSKARGCGFFGDRQKSESHIRSRRFRPFPQSRPRVWGEWPAFCFPEGPRSFPLTAEQRPPGPAIYNPRDHSKKRSPRWTIK
jgi:hypothetical protein